MEISEFMKNAAPEVLSNKAFNKIFCVGYNKTGTTTMEWVLKLYGYKMPDQLEQEIRLTKRCFSCDYTEFASFVGAYDAFQDLPFSQGEVYVAADALFPDSKFILTERDPEAWFKSLTRFHQKVFGLESMEGLTEEDVSKKMNYLYPGYVHEYKKRILTNFVGDVAKTDWSLLYDKDYYISDYLQRNNRIKQYFQNCSEKLLVIDVTQEKTTKKVCDFLNIPDHLVVDMPQLNKT